MRDLPFSSNGMDYILIPFGDVQTDGAKSGHSPFIYGCRILIVSMVGKIQGDGRKFLDHFKSYGTQGIQTLAFNSSNTVCFFHRLLSRVVSPEPFSVAHGTA